MVPLLPALYFAWGIGAADAANTFGPQIGASVISFRRAVLLAALFVFVGAVLEGPKVFPTLGQLTALTLETSVVAALSAGLTMHLLVRFGMPVSSSHAIVGALMAVGLFQHTGLDTGILRRIGLSLITVPVGAAAAAYVLYRILGVVLPRRLGVGLFFQTTVRLAAVVIGSYGAYALGANHVGNAVAPFVGIGLLTPSAGAALGGLAIAAGVLTYSRNIIMLVGKQITALDPVSALVAVAASAATVHLFTELAIPVSTSQAMVGAIVGVGLTKGMVAVNSRTLAMIPVAWVISILGSGALAYALMAASTALR
jgi:PiT family inorganic phosphate transporter